MNTLTKGLLSLAPIANIALFILMMTPSSFLYHLDMTIYSIICYATAILMLLHIVILVVRIRRFKKVPKREKNIWTGLVTIYFLIGTLPYIWMKDDEFVKLENKELN